MMQYFRKPLLVCLLAAGLSTPVAGTFAQNTQPEKTGQSLQSFFQQLLSRKAVVGGTVMRGENDTTAAGSKPLLLADEAVFKVLPGSSFMLLAWSSTAGDHWEVSVAGQTLQVQGGFAKVPVPELAAQGLYPWELRKKGSSKTHFSGHWFFIQNIEAADGKQLLDLMKQAGGSTDQQNVCNWMWGEQLVEFNELCIQTSGLAAGGQQG